MRQRSVLQRTQFVDEPRLEEEVLLRAGGQVVSAEDLLEQAKSRFNEKAEERGIVLMLDIQEPLPRLHADESQLERVLDNLLDNALRHTPENGLIRLQGRRQGEREARWWCRTVSCSGMPAPRRSNRWRIPSGGTAWSSPARPTTC